MTNVVKIVEIGIGWVEGMDREVNGLVEINGAVFNFELSTDDGMTSIYVKDENDCVASAEDADELADELGLQFDNEELYDDILNACIELGFELED
jgi:hypothetical protein